MLCALGHNNADTLDVRGTSHSHTKVNLEQKSKVHDKHRARRLYVIVVTQARVTHGIYWLSSDVGPSAGLEGKRLY